MTPRLILIAVVLIALSVFMSMKAQPSISSGPTRPVPLDELMQLNPD